MPDFKSENYLNPISDEYPSGINLENDLMFSELENAARFIGEKQMGGVIVPASEPDWPKVRELALVLLTKSRDIQVAMYLTCALLRIEGLPGFAEGLALIEGLLDRFWDSVYPQRDDGDSYPVLRVNILSTLKDQQMVLNALSKAKLSESKIGAFSWYDASVAQGRLNPANKNAALADMTMIEAAFKDTASSVLKAHKAGIARISSRVKAITEIANHKSGEPIAPDQSPLFSLLKQIDGLLDEQLARHPQTDMGEAFPEVKDIATATSQMALSSPGVIQSREEVIKTLDAICRYFERYEPSSPIPFLLLRARKLTTMNFMDILRDMAPEALNRAETICGVQAKDN